MRIRTIDACLQRRQRLWTLEDLREACEQALFEAEGISGISTRTIQRDIELMRSDKLGYAAPIVVRDRKYYAYADPDFSIKQLPLSRQDLQQLGVALDIIRQYSSFRGMVGQEDILARMQDRLRVQEDHSQAIFIETNHRLKGLQFLSPLYDYIVAHAPVVIHYQSFRSSRPGLFHLSPYLLKEFNNRWFLIAYSQKMKNLQTLALDRIVSVERDEASSFVPNTFFAPATYLGEMVGVTRDLYSQPETVTLRVDADQAPYVLTKPMHDSQQLVSRDEDGSIVISLCVILNRELERLIIGFGNHIEVIAPRLLRHRICRSLMMALAHYQR